MNARTLTIALAAAICLGWRTQAQAAMASSDGFAQRCAALITDKAAGIDAAIYREAGPAPRPPRFGPPNPPALIVPAHCEVHGILDRHDGADGQHYAIRYHLRLPLEWNGRFLFQGGGGTNGVVGDALGAIGAGRAPAITQGYAVVSQDSGHDNDLNNDPGRGGQTVFGGDPQARAAYGGASLKRVADVAQSLIGDFYDRKAAHSYFYGCSKGGQEGMAFAQRYPDVFDGIVAGAPGFALPRAALAQVWDVQTFGALVRQPGAKSFAFPALAASFSDAQLALIGKAVLRACDALDGLSDGIVERFGQCTAALVLPELHRTECGADAGDACLTRAQIAAILRSLRGPRNGAGKSLYTSWPWDAGIGSFGWRMWKLGSPQMPALNVVTGGPAVAMIFSVPPTPLDADPQSYVDFEAGFDFAKGDGTRIYKKSHAFTRSAWEDLQARSPNLDAFRKHGGKLIVPHGVSDPVFSINDTLAWYADVQRRYGKDAAAFARVFPVPGMTHCGMGPATDNFDAFGALVDWVEHAHAPDTILASAGPTSPWPGRTRPLCAYPSVATYKGSGSVEAAENFECR